MAFFFSTELVIPAIQMAVLLGLNTLALLFGRIKLALLITYTFTLYWGYVINRDFLMESGSEGIGCFAYIYFGFGLMVVIFALAGFLAHQHQ